MATAAAVTPPAERFERLALDLIDPDPDQPRKTFDELALRELADSIKAHGVVVPIKVRPHAKKPGRYMLVAGERRWRGSKLAGATDIPAVIEDLDAVAALEQQIIENSQRVDVHPLEEAEAYELLMKKHGYTIDKLIAKTGRSKAHLYGRMKLLQLAHGPRQALVAGKLPMAHAELIARIADAKLQEQCTREVLGTIPAREYGALEDLGIQYEQLAEDGKSSYDGEPQPLSFDATRALIRRRYTTKLSLAKFDTGDPNLTKAGACTSCSHRSGNQPELPGMPSLSKDDLCTKPSCFEEKSKATWKKASAAAKERGLEIVEEPNNVFEFDGVTVSIDSPYVEPDAQLPANLQKTPGSKATWSKLLGSQIGEIPRALVQDESGAPRELLNRTAAVKLLRDQGKIEKPEPPKKSSSSSSSSSSSKDWEAQRAKEKREKELSTQALTRTLEQIAAGAAADPGKKDLAMWRWIASVVLRDAWDADIAMERRGLKAGDRKALAAAVDKCKTIADVRSLLVECLASVVGDHGTGPYANKAERELFDDACKLFGGDYDKALATAKEAAKVEAKADAAKKAKKDDAKKTPAKAKKGKGK